MPGSLFLSLLHGNVIWGRFGADFRYRHSAELVHFRFLDRHLQPLDLWHIGEVSEPDPEFEDAGEGLSSLLIVAGGTLVRPLRIVYGLENMIRRYAMVRPLPNYLFTLCTDYYMFTGIRRFQNGVLFLGPSMGIPVGTPEERSPRESQSFLFVDLRPAPWAPYLVCDPRSECGSRRRK